MSWNMQYRIGKEAVQKKLNAVGKEYGLLLCELVREMRVM
jgi:hypothetical protein